MRRFGVCGVDAVERGGLGGRKDMIFDSRCGDLCWS